MSDSDTWMPGDTLRGSNGSELLFRQMLENGCFMGEVLYPGRSSGEIQTGEVRSYWRVDAFHRVCRAGKVRFVVVDRNENALAYVQPERPLWANVLATTHTKGVLVKRDHDVVYLPGEYVRPATLADFDTFRVSTAGYSTDPRYDFPAT